MSGYLLVGGLGVAVFAVFLYRKMAKAGSPMFKIGYSLYTKTRFGYFYYRREVEKAHRKYNNQSHSVVKDYEVNGLSISPIPMSLDNYGYLVHDQKSGISVLVDPADPGAVQEVLKRKNITPAAILTTHKHWDHSAGNLTWKDKLRGVRIYGGAGDHVPGATDTVSDGDKLQFGDLSFRVLATPGHTVGHVVYILEGFGTGPSLFSGDVLFLAGMGRMFEGSSAVMLQSILSICNLPDDTLVWPGHEYADDDLEFALHLEPNNEAVAEKYRWVKEMRKGRQGTCPSTLAEEKTYNPFLRLNDASLLNSLGLEGQSDLTGDELKAKTLAECRARKDKFKYKL